MQSNGSNNGAVPELVRMEKNIEGSAWSKALWQVEDVHDQSRNIRQKAV